MTDAQYQMDHGPGSPLDVERLEVSAAIEGEVPEATLPVQETAKPHGDKLDGLQRNAKLPPADRLRVEQAKERYNEWVAAMDGLPSEGDERVRDLVTLLNRYKLYLDLELIFDSPENFLVGRVASSSSLALSLSSSYRSW